MNSGDNTFHRLAVAAAVVAAFLVFGASGAQPASAHAIAASGSLAAEETDQPSDEESEDPDEEDSEDEEDSDDEDSEDEDSESDEPTDEPSDQPTFTDPTDDATDDVTEMPTTDAAATSETAASPLGWILLGLGVASAIAAFLVYRRNRPL